MLEARDLRKSFDGFAVLKGINLELRKGSVLVVLGLSGSGKTTLLKIFSGALQADSGMVEVFGTSLIGISAAELSAYRRRLGVVFQYSALLGSLTVRENIALPMVETQGMRLPECEERVRDALSRVFLNADDVLDRKPAQLSGGMRKRVGIARALVQEPELLLYDEPTSGLDPVTARGVDELVIRLKRDLGMTSLVITHDIDGAMRIADHIAILHLGEILALGTPDELRESQHPAVRQLLDGTVDGPLTADFAAAAQESAQ
ncbi:MAG: ATP-binding cassette domain-containing protein [Planctomycetota bacterium]|nr:MAG: ATP-binding cassette domain-containing protein [Planctomycetota bacterium]